MTLTKHPGIKITFEISAPIVAIKNRTLLFEKAMEGKEAINIQDITSKIDCFLSAAHTIASQLAVENAYEITPSKQTTLIRDMTLKAEIIYSHLNHIYKRVIPGLYNFHNYFEFAKNHEKEFEKNN